MPFLVRLSEFPSQLCFLGHTRLVFLLLKDFLYTNQCEIGNIIVYGHSCAIDFEYFNYLNARYANANWTFYVVKEEQESSVLQLIKRYSIKGADIVVL